MKKTLLSVFILMMAASLLAGCGSDLETRIANLEEQLTLLQGRVDALEGENAALRAALESAGSVEIEPDAEASAELYLNDWLAEDGQLTLDIFARAMLPEGAEVTDARILLLSGETRQELVIDLNPGEAGGSFEADITGLTFTIPELESDDELELQLMVTFTGGNVVHGCGVGWYPEDGMLCLISG